MKKKIKKFFKVTFLAFLSAFLTIAVIILFPEPLFANKLKYKEFTVCSNSTIDKNIIQVLDQAKALVQQSELYDSTYHYNIILAHRTFYNKIDDKIIGYGPAARARLNNVIIKIRIDPTNNVAFPTFPKACETNLTELIAHEMLHCLQANKYGVWKFNPYKHPPFWKLEGYPEYISKQAKLSGKEYNLANEIDRYMALKSKITGIWIADEGGCEAPDFYFKGRLMMEYLMDIKKMSYDQVLADTVSENTVYEEMIRWHNTAKKIN